mgnify:CR=1 FL=1
MVSSLGLADGLGNPGDDREQRACIGIQILKYRIEIASVDIWLAMFQ